MKLCSNCGAPAEDEARFCMNCAQGFPSTGPTSSSGGMEATMAARSCPRCSSTNTARAKYCNECGASMSGMELGYQTGLDGSKIRRIAIISAVIVALVVIGLMIFLVLKPAYTPGETVKEVVRAMEKGNIERVLEFMPDKERQGLSRAFKDNGGVSAIIIKEEKILDDKRSATVEFEIKMGNGETRSGKSRLVKENGIWKLESLGSFFFL